MPGLGLHSRCICPRTPKIEQETYPPKMAAGTPASAKIVANFSGEEN